jgi:hypothetical protein
MLYQLPNGKCVELTLEQFLRLTDEDLKGMIAYNAGEDVNDPFALSVLRYGPHKSIEDEELGDFDEMPMEDLTDVSNIEKLIDSDYIDYDNLEQ